MASKKGKNQEVDLEKIMKEAAQSFSKESTKILKEIQKKNESQRKLMENRTKAKTKEDKDRIDDIIDENARKIRELMEEYNSGVASFWDEWTDQEKEAFAERSDMLDDSVRETEEAIDKIRGRLISSIEEVSEEVEESLDEFSDSFSDRMRDISEQLREWSNALNLTALVDSTKENLDSYMDNIRQMRVATGDWFDEKGFNKATTELVKQTRAYNRSESSEFITSMMTEFGLKQMDQASEYTSEFAAAVKAFGNDISDYENIMWKDINGGYRGKLVRGFNNVAASLEDNQYLNVKGNDMISKLNESAETIMSMYGKDEKKRKGMFKSIATIEALQESAATEGVTTVAEKLQEWGRMNLPKLTQDESFLAYSNLTGIDATTFQQKWASGDVEDLVIPLQRSLNNIGGDNEIAKQYNLDPWMDALDFSDYTDLMSFTNTSEEDLKNWIEQAQLSIDKAEQATEGGESLTTGKTLESLTKLEELSNLASVNKVITKTSDYISKLGLDDFVKWSDLANKTIVASGGIGLANSIIKGVKIGKGGKGFGGKMGGFLKGFFGFGDDAVRAAASAEQAVKKGGLFSKITGLFKRGSKGAEEVEQAATKGKFFSKMKNFFKFGSKNADEIAKGAGKTGLLSKLGDLFKGSKVLGKLGSVGKVAGKAGGPIAALFALLDGISGIKNAKKWTGDKKLSSKITSFFGGILGGTGPGLFDKGSAGSKILNVLGGAGKGAAAGAALGTIFPGIGNLIGAGVGAIVGAITHAIGGKRITKFFKFIGGKIAGAASKARDFIVGAWKNLSYGISGITKKLKEKWDNFSESITAWKDKLATSFKTLTDWFESTKIGGWLSKKFSAKGMGKGAVAGAALGSFVPGVGTLVGAGIGTVIGGKKKGKAKGKAKGYAKGLSEVPFDNFPAFLHEGEAILTKKQAEVLKKADGGIDIKGFDELNKTITNLGSSKNLDLWKNSLGFSDWDDIKSFKNMSENDLSSFIGKSIPELMKSSEFQKYSALTGMSAQDFYNKFSSHVDSDSVMTMNRDEFIRNFNEVASRVGGKTEDKKIDELISYLRELKNKLFGRFVKEDKDYSRLVRNFNENGLLGSSFKGGTSGILQKLTKGIFGSSGLGKDISNLLSGKGTGGSLMTRLKQIFGGDNKKKSTSSGGASTGGTGIGTGAEGEAAGAAAGSGKGVLAFHKNIPGSGAERWRPYVVDALKANKLSTSKKMQNKVIKQIKSESGGDPKAINNWDSNAKKGTPSKGLLQTIEPTFNAHKFKGHSDIWNGYDNMLAAIHYAKGRYGKSLMNKNGQGIGSGKGYAVGTPFVPNDQVALVHQGEMIVPASQNPMNNPTSSISVDRLGNSDNTQVIETMKWQVSRLEVKLDRLISAVEGKSKRRMPREASDELNEAFSSVKRPGMGVL